MKGDVSRRQLREVGRFGLQNRDCTQAWRLAQRPLLWQPKPMPAKKPKKAALLERKSGDTSGEAAAGHLLAMMEAALSMIVEEATIVGVGELQLSDLADLTAQTLEIARSWVPGADAVLPGPSTASERIEAWRNTIANRMEPSGSLMEEEKRKTFALAIVVECARASGHPRPSALFHYPQKRKE